LRGGFHGPLAACTIGDRACDGRLDVLRRGAANLGLAAADLYCGRVGGEGFAVDASLIVADANKQRSIPGSEWNKARDPHGASRAMREYFGNPRGWLCAGRSGGLCRCIVECGHLTGMT
jgi:hypothetical protein